MGSRWAGSSGGGCTRLVLSHKLRHDWSLLRPKPCRWSEKGGAGQSHGGPSALPGPGPHCPRPGSGPAQPSGGPAPLRSLSSPHSDPSHWSTLPAYLSQASPTCCSPGHLWVPSSSCPRMRAPVSEFRGAGGQRQRTLLETSPAQRPCGRGQEGCWGPRGSAVGLCAAPEVVAQAEGAHVSSQPRTVEPPGQCLRTGLSPPLGALVS